MFVSIDWLQLAMRREQLVNHFPNIHLENECNIRCQLNMYVIKTFMCLFSAYVMQLSLPHLERISINSRPLRVHDGEQAIDKNKRKMLTSVSSVAEDPCTSTDEVVRKS